MKVQIRANAEYDLASSAELQQHYAQLDARFNELIRDQLRGIKLIRLPQVNILASGATVTIPGTQGGTGAAIEIGPESGFVWRIGRITVSSNVAADNKAAGAVPVPGLPVSLYVSSDGGTDGARGLVDTSAACGAAYYPGSRGMYLMPSEQLVAVITGTTAGSVYTFAGQAISVPAEMMGKLI